MRPLRCLALAVMACVLVVGMLDGRAGATTTGSVNMTWKTLPLINLTITPNYQSGYGPSGGSGSGSTPAPGASAAPSAGWIDFGKTVQGYSYLYKYAAKASVMTNDSSGFQVYAESTTDSTNQTDATTVPISQVLFWLLSTTSNNPFSPATPFQRTSGLVTGCATVSPCSITYGSYPSTPVWSYGSGTIGQPGNIVSQGFDYQLRLNSATATVGVYNVIVVYTAVGN